MMRRSLLLSALVLSACGDKPDASATQAHTTAVPIVSSAPVRLTTSDGVTIFGSYYRAPSPKALILLFHQAGSSRGEYATIAPRLVQAGYSALAIDQRSGGTLYGVNETVATLGSAAPQGDAGYLKAMPDLEAALDWGSATKLPVIVWGSSYSSSLVFTLAADHPHSVAALLAFSPGEYFDDKTMVERAAAKLTVPAYITSASKPDEIAAAATIAHAVPHGLATQYVPKSGVHGSSTLIAEKDPEGAETNWLPVLAFLKKVAP